jgi:Family of unknown function (DUF6526)
MEQNLRNHAKFVPAFHFFIVPVFFANVIITITRLVHVFNFERAFAVVLAIALLVLAFLARVFALTVQDRVIRLEMKLRLREVLPPDLWARYGELKIGQVVSLRYASDAELPELTRKVLDEKLTDRKAIKLLVQQWRPDHLRA